MSAAVCCEPPRVGAGTELRLSVLLTSEPPLQPEHMLFECTGRQLSRIIDRVFVSNDAH